MITKYGIAPFTKAIVRRPSPEIVHGVTTAALGKPDFDLAIRQHDAYVQALRESGLSVRILPALP